MNRPQIRAELNAARASAERRLSGVVDPDERNALLHALDELDAAIQDIDSNDLLKAASVTANAADALSDAVSLSKPPFDLFVMELLTSAQTLSGEVSLMQGSERLPQALLDQTSTPALAPIAV